MPSIKRILHLLVNDPIHFLDYFITKIGFMFPDKLYLSLRYRLNMGRWIDWKNPTTFTEKLQWLKIYGFKPEYTQMVDKLAVKDYVASRIGKEHIIPTLGVWDRVEDIDWDSLPNQFVLKTTHGGGGCGVVICSDKSKIDKEKALRKLAISMKSNAGYSYREKPYRDVPRKIIAEKFMASERNQAPADLPDYKFFCFNGEPKYCQVIRDRHSKETIDFYDMSWNHQEFVGLSPVARNGLTPVARNGLTPVARPKNLEEMIDICRGLSKEIPFVRVDLYVIDDKKYFGELTFYPASGFGEFTPMEWGLKLGELLSLPGNAVSGGGKKYIIINSIISELKAEYDELVDYKFFCFNGRVKFFKVDFGRFVEHHANYYSPQGEILLFGEKGLEPDFHHAIDLPVNLDEMIDIAEKLSASQSFLRVDLYNVSKEIFFGELTFYPGSGMVSFTSTEWDEKIGEMITL